MRQSPATRVVAAMVILVAAACGPGSDPSICDDCDTTWAVGEWFFVGSCLEFPCRSQTRLFSLHVFDDGTAESTYDLICLIDMHPADPSPGRWVPLDDDTIEIRAVGDWNPVRSHDSSGQPVAFRADGDCHATADTTARPSAQEQWRKGAPIFSTYSDCLGDLLGADPDPCAP